MRALSLAPLLAVVLSLAGGAASAQAACGDNLTVPNAPGQDSAVVTYDCSPAVCSPASGSEFPVGTTLVRCDSADAFTVTVQDTEKPVITAAPAVVRDNDRRKDYATYTPLAPEVTDNAAGVTTTCDHPPGKEDFFALGTTTVTCTARDAAGNTATAATTVEVKDVEPPVLQVPAPIATISPTVVYAYFARDNSGTVATQSCTPGSGELFALGTTVVSCTATDPSGNTVTATFQVEVGTEPPVEFQGAFLDHRSFRPRTGKRGGATLRYALSTSAKVTVKLRRCKGKRCTALATLKDRGSSGLNKLRITAIKRGKRLPPGRYKAVLSATDEHGNAAAPATVSFRLLR